MQQVCVASGVHEPVWITASNELEQLHSASLQGNRCSVRWLKCEFGFRPFKSLNPDSFPEASKNYAWKGIIRGVYVLHPIIVMAIEPTYCYHCRSHHPRNEMRLIVTKTGKRWRCIRSIEATQQGAEAREAYGRQVSEINRAESKSRAQRLNNLLQEK